MENNKIDAKGFEPVIKLLNEKGIEIEQQDLASVFMESVQKQGGESVNASIFADAISENIGIEQNEDILNAVNEIAKSDGVEDEISLSDINLQAQKLQEQGANKSDVNAEIINVLNNVVSSQEKILHDTKENQGVIAKGWDWIKNKTGLGAGSNKSQKKVDDLKAQIADLQKDPSKLGEVYKNVTGNELNQEELEKLKKGETDFSKSDLVNSVSKYQQGQKQAVKTISGITSGLATVGLVTTGVVAAPFTGGMSLGASFAAIGALSAAGTAAYMVPSAIDGLTEKDGYGAKEVAEDLASGVVNSAATAVGTGAGKAIATNLVTKATTQAGRGAATLAACEASSVIIGDGIAVGDYLVQTAANDEVDFSLEELGKTTASATAASLAAGVTALGTSNVLRPILTSGQSAQSQLLGRFLSSGISGAGAGASASAVGGSTNYLISCAVDGKEVDFDDWLNATTENVAAGTLTGFGAGVAFEAVQVSSGAPKPEKAIKTEKITNQDGVKCKNYYDKNGNLIATDVKPKDLAKYMNSQNGQEQGTSLVKNVENSGNTRVIRFTFDNKNTVVNKNGSSYDIAETYIKADKYDWADNVKFLGDTEFISAKKISDGKGSTQAAQESATQKALSKKYEYKVNHQDLNKAVDNEQQAIDYIENYINNNPDSKIPKELITEKAKVLTQLSKQAEELARHFDSQIDEGAGQINNAFKDSADINILSARAKSQKSIFSKLASKYLSGKLTSTDFQSCYDTICDALGTRIQVSSLQHGKVKSYVQSVLDGTGISYEEFTNYMSGKTKVPENLQQTFSDLSNEVLTNLKTQQMDGVVNKLCDGIKTGNIKITEINNYGDDISSYFTTEQLQKIVDAYDYAVANKNIEASKPLDIVSKKNIVQDNRWKVQNDGSYGVNSKINPDEGFSINQKSKGAVKETGYATCQSNTEHRLENGEIAYGELQIRGKKLNAFADVEHIPYDIRKGKIYATDAKYSDIFNLIKSMTPENYQKYNNYLTDTYHSIRMQELGLLPENTPMPQLETYLKSGYNAAELKLLSTDGLIEISSR